MLGRLGSKYFLAMAVFAAALASGATARAHEGGGDEHGGGHGEGGHGDGGHGEGEGGQHGEGNAQHRHGKHHPHEHKATIGLDFVAGFGKVPFAVQSAPPPNGAPPGYESGAARTASQSFVLGTAFHLLPHTAFGVRLPFSFGEFSPPDGSTRGTGALGNIELEAEYERHMSHHLELFFVLGFSMPTGQGNPIPENIGELPNSAIDVGLLDKGALNRAASLARGGEETALFELKRWGINPKIGVNYRMGALTITPYIKMENLIASTSSLAKGYLGELIPAVRAGYRVGQFEPALKLWAPIIFAGAEEGEKKVGFVVEPQLVFHHGNVRPMLGVIIPVAGPAADPSTNIGVRLGVAAAF